MPDPEIPPPPPGSLLPPPSAAQHPLPPPPGAEVPSSPPSRPWGVIAAVIGAIVVLVAVAVVLTGSDSEPGVYDDHGITFRYPEDWGRQVGAEKVGQVGQPFFEDRFGFDAYNAIVISGYQLRGEPTEADRDAVRSALQDVSDFIADAIDGRTVAPVSDLDVPGFMAFDTELEGTVEGKAIGTRMINLVRGDVQYAFVCQWTDEGEADVRAACEQFLRTVHPS
jgi:hypothetical protein